MKPLIKKVSFVAIALAICFSVFSFKSAETNELELSNMDNYAIIEMSSNSVSFAEPQASWARAAVGAVVKAAKWAWGKNYVAHAALALCPIMKASDEILASKADMLKEVRIAEL